MRRGRREGVRGGRGDGGREMTDIQLLCKCLWRQLCFLAALPAVLSSSTASRSQDASLEPLPATPLPEMGENGKEPCVKKQEGGKAIDILMHQPCQHSSGPTPVWLTSS